MNFVNATLLVSTSIFGLNACKQIAPSEGQVKEAQRVSEQGRSPLKDLRLFDLENNFIRNGVPIPTYRAENVGLKLPFSSPSKEQTSIDIIFEKLTQAQCQTLRAVYYRTDIPCGENGVFPLDNRQYQYTIKDFISPVMQATLKLTFKPELLVMGNEQFTNEFGKQTRLLSKRLEANCWSTAYEISRQQTKQYTVHVIQPSDLDKIFKNPDYTDLKFFGSSGGLEAAIRDKGLGRFGQLLIVRSKNDNKELQESKGDIQHAAVFVDRFLIFERIGNAAHLPMRLGQLESILTSYPDTNHTYEIRQVIKPFPHVTQIPNLQTSIESSGGYTFGTKRYYYGTEIAIKDFNLERVGWEYRLPNDAFSISLR